MNDLIELTYLENANRSQKDLDDFTRACNDSLALRISAAQTLRADRLAAANTERESGVRALEHLRRQLIDSQDRLTLAHNLITTELAMANSSEAFYHGMTADDILNIPEQSRYDAASRIGLQHESGSVANALHWTQYVLLVTCWALISVLIGFAYLGINPHRPLDMPWLWGFALVAGATIPLAVSALNNSMWPHSARDVVSDLVNAFAKQGFRQASRSDITDETRHSIILKVIATGATGVGFTCTDSYAVTRLSEAHNPFSSQAILPAWAAMLMGALLGALYTVATAASAYVRGYQGAAAKAADGEINRFEQAYRAQRLQDRHVQAAIQALATFESANEKVRVKESEIKQKEKAVDDRYRDAVEGLPPIPSDILPIEKHQIERFREARDRWYEALDQYRKNKLNGPATPAAAVVGVAPGTATAI